RLDGTVAAEPALQVEHDSKALRSVARLIHQGSHDPAERHRHYHREETVDALRPQTQSLHGRERERSLEKARNQANHEARARSAREGSPHRGHKIEMPECGQVVVTVIESEDRGSNGQQDPGAYRFCRTRVKAHSLIAPASGTRQRTRPWPDIRAGD